MEMNELFLCDASAAVDEISPLPLPLPLPLTLPPPLHVHSSSTSWDPFLPLLNVTPHFHLEGDGHGGGGLDFDSVLLGSLPMLPSCNDESLVIRRLFGGNALPFPRTHHSRHHPLSPGPGKFSCFDWRNPLPVQNVNAPALVPGNCDSPNCKDGSSRSLDGSSISEQVTGKRKCLDRGKAKEPSKFAEGGDDSVITTVKRSREDEELDGGDDIGPAKRPKLGNEEDEEEEEGRKKKKSKKGGGGGGGGDGVEPPKDYIHVRARRGQATDSHSLAERVRREKISERMKMLQDLVPTCSKVSGKALMLDEIINYVQSLQRQVEFLSMKLASVNTNMNGRIISKDMFQSSNNAITTTTTTAAAQLPMFEPPLHEKMQEGTSFQYSADPPLAVSRILPLNGLDDRILAPFRGEDLHSIVEMGLFGQTNHLGFAGQEQMNNNNNNNNNNIMNMEELQQ